MPQPIRPETTGLTPEALEALGITPEQEQEIVEEQLGGGTSSDADSEPELDDNIGDIVDAEIVNDSPEAIEPPKSSRTRSKRETPTPSRSAKAGPPTLDEWQQFFGRV